MVRLSVDIGGTFTDVVLERDGRIVSFKTLTTPDAPEIGALTGINELLKTHAVSLDTVHNVVHGTTLATNALIERRGARTAFITTEGFRDILEMGYEKRFDQYDVNLRLPEPLVPRERRLTLGERLDANGRVLRAPEQHDIDALAAQLQNMKVEAVAVGLIHAYANPEHERAVAERLSMCLGNRVTVCRSAEVSPEIREYERFSTVCANAYVRPLMSRYLQRFDSLLRDGGFTGQLLLMLSGGGLTTLEHAMRVPIRLVESGPAGGVALGARVARETHVDHLLAFDMGGTTAKICFLEGGVADTSRRFEVARAWRDIKGSGLPVRIPTTELVEIGAGGGSIARCDSLGRLAVGPQSASSHPGPAAYGLGGTAATVTDADVVLGKFDAQRFAQGAFTLRSDLAERAIADTVTSPLGFSSTLWAASGIAEIAEEAMANAARVHALERGKDITRYELMASGGAGPLHAVRVAEKLGIARVIVPLNAGVGSAVGFLSAPVAYEVARTVLGELQTLDLDALSALQTDMEHEVRSVVAPALSSETTVEISMHAELRYLGQGHELRVKLIEPLCNQESLDTLHIAFLSHYRSVYGVSLENNPIELVSLGLIARGPVPENSVHVAVPAKAMRTSSDTTDLFDASSGEMLTLCVHERDAQVAGDHLTTPCLIREAQTTTVVPPGWLASVHAAGHLLLEREPVP